MSIYFATSVIRPPIEENVAPGTALMYTLAGLSMFVRFESPSIRVCVGALLNCLALFSFRKTSSVCHVCDSGFNCNNLVSPMTGIGVPTLILLNDSSNLFLTSDSRSCSS